MICYIEDDKNISDLVVFTLNMTGFTACGFPDAASFRASLDKTLPELILLDIMLPGEDGMSLLRYLKQERATMGIPVILISAKTAEFDKVLGLEVGADDYITKPFSMMELIARVKAVLRRSRESEDAKPIQVGGICMDPVKHTVTSGGQSVALTLKEFELLRFLMENAGTAFDRDKLLSAVWSIDYYGGTRTVDVHIQTLRKKLGEAGEHIETIYGYGYRIHA